MKAHITYAGKTIELPVLNGTEGHAAIDIRILESELGLLTYDPGFMCTASCQSGITFIDGDKGILRYRGYDIADLAEKADFMDVTYLLWYGELPNEEKKKEFVGLVTRHTMVNEQVRTFYQGFRRDAHPMAIMVGVVGALSAFYHDSLDIHDPKHREVASFRLIAKMPTIAAMAYKYAVGQPFVYPQNHLSYSENLMRMLFAVPAERYEHQPVLEKALERILVLHADHEQNASTATVRLAGSSGANPFACIASGIATLWGPAHGGANEAVLNMLQTIGTKERIPEFLARAKDKSDPFRLMGFGHRIYRNYDPRALIMQQTCHEVLDYLHLRDPLLDLAMELEAIALGDPYFVERKLYPNVDFYSGIVLRALGIPTSMFTVLFAVARSVGWVAQWREMISATEQKIGRPRQLYVGFKGRPLKKR